MELAIGFGLLLLFAVASASLATANPSEEQFSYSELRQRRAKSSNIADQRSSPVQAPETLLKRKGEFRPEQIIDSEPTVERTTVGSIMELPPYYCYQGQDLRIARIMMRENHLQTLPVVDVYKRIVGTITMHDIAAFEEQRRK
jgi:CBS domain-containing protein